MYGAKINNYRNREVGLGLSYCFICIANLYCFLCKEPCLRTITVLLYIGRLLFLYRIDWKCFVVFIHGRQSIYNILANYVHSLLC